MKNFKTLRKDLYTSKSVNPSSLRTFFFSMLYYGYKLKNTHTHTHTQSPFYLLLDKETAMN